MQAWQNHINNTKEILSLISARDIEGHDIDIDIAFKQLKNNALGVMERRKTIYFIGNGVSASIANDASASLAQNTGIHTETFFNFSLITAIANTSSYEDIFAAPLRKRMATGDMLVAISTSGESQSIINAVNEAHKIGGNVCTLSAMNPGNTLRSLGSLNYYIPAESSRNANLCYMEIMNYWIDQLVSIVSWQEDIKIIGNQ